MDPATGTQEMQPTPNPTVQRNGKQIASAALFLVGGILALVSAFVAWFSLSQSGATISFLPGSSFTVSGSGMTLTENYASFGIGPVGGLYLAILALAIIAGVLALVAGILGMVVAMGRMPAKRGGMVKGLVIGAVVLALVAVVIAPAVQPWAVNDSGSKGSSCSGYNGTSPCNSFWGSGTVGGASTSWGASTGWYLALVTVILAIVGLVLWRPARGMMSA